MGLCQTGAQTLLQPQYHADFRADCLRDWHDRGTEHSGRSVALTGMAVGYGGQSGLWYDRLLDYWSVCRKLAVLHAHLQNQALRSTWRTGNQDPAGYDYRVVFLSYPCALGETTCSLVRGARTGWNFMVRLNAKRYQSFFRGRCPTCSSKKALPARKRVHCQNYSHEHSHDHTDHDYSQWTGQRLAAILAPLGVGI